MKKIKFLTLMVLFLVLASLPHNAGLPILLGIYIGIVWVLWVNPLSNEDT